MTTNWLVAAGPASNGISHELARNLDAKLLEFEITEYSDGESKIRCSHKVRDQNIALVQSLYPPQSKHLMQLLFVAHKLSEEGAKVDAVVPYLAYARQDKEFLRGEVVSIAAVGKLFRAVGIRRLITINIHSPEGLGLLSFPSYSCSAIPTMAEYICSNFHLSNPIAVSPDFGSSERVEAFAQVMKSDYAVFKKHRDRHTGAVTIEEQNLNLSGRDAIIVDDSISGGGTIVKMTELLKKYGARRVIVTCVHALLAAGVPEKIFKSGVDEIVASNTVPSKYSKVDVSPIISSYYR